MNLTEKTIVGMLQESTGTHFLDSGGAYGRYWEENQKIKNWNRLPRVTAEIWDEEINLSIPIYHFLTSFLTNDDVSKKLEKELYEFSETEEMKDECWLSIMESFADKLDENTWKPTKVYNSYNYDNLISQVFQHIDLHNKETDNWYIILQIHNGCDVRGGYTDPKIFEVIDPDHFHMAQFDIRAGCECMNIWSDDCGYHWYNGNTEKVDIAELRKNKWLIKGGKNKYLWCKKCKKRVWFEPSLDF